MKFAKMLGFILLAGALVLGFGAFSASAYAQDEDVSVTETVDVGEGGAEEGEGAAAEPQEQTFLTVVLGGTWLDKTIWLLIFATSFATVALLIDAGISIRMNKIMPPELVEAVKNALNEGDLGAAIEACEATPGPLSNILMAGFNNISEGYDVVVDAVSASADIETEKLMQRVNYLNLCGAIAPMLGLQGTVTGMVSAFSALGSATGAAKAQMLAMSISTALYTTAVGLVIAIPAVLGYTFVKNNASKIILTMEALTYDLIKTLKGAEVVGDEEEAAVEE